MPLKSLSCLHHTPKSLHNFNTRLTLPPPTTQEIHTSLSAPCNSHGEDMFATLTSPFHGGHHGGMQNHQAMAIQMELGQLKSAPVLNPHFGMVIKYLDCLNRLMDALVLTQGPDGVRVWLIEVQTFIRQLQKRVFQRMPLTPQERQAVVSFTSYWRQMVQPPYAMGRPEAQLVLISLTEFASM